MITNIINNRVISSSFFKTVKIYHDRPISCDVTTRAGWTARNACFVDDKEIFFTHDFP